MKYLLSLALCAVSFGGTIKLSDDNFQVEGRDGFIFSLFVPGDVIKSAMLTLTVDVWAYLAIEQVNQFGEATLNTVVFTDLQGYQGVNCAYGTDGPQCLVNLTLDIADVLQNGQNYIELYAGQRFTDFCCESLDAKVKYATEPEPSYLAIVGLALLAGGLSQRTWLSRHRSRGAR